MRLLRGLFIASSTLALSCRNPPAAPPSPRAAPQSPAPAAPATDVPPPVDAVPGAVRGLVATLMACSPPTRVTTGGAWTLTLRLTVHNQSTAPLTLRREGIQVTADELARGDLTASNAVEGAGEIPPRGRVTLILRPQFPASENPPISVTFAFDSRGGLNHPISFPVPSAR